MSDPVFILSRVGQHPSDRSWLRFENSAPVWTTDRARAAIFSDDVSALAMVDRDRGPAYEGGATFETEPVTT